MQTLRRWQEIISRVDLDEDKNAKSKITGEESAKNRCTEEADDRDEKK